MITKTEISSHFFRFIVSTKLYSLKFSSLFYFVILTCKWIHQVFDEIIHVLWVVKLGITATRTICISVFDLFMNHLFKSKAIMVDREEEYLPVITQKKEYSWKAGNK